MSTTNHQGNARKKKPAAEPDGISFKTATDAQKHLSWEAIQQFYQSRSLAFSNIETWNRFVQQDLAEIVHDNGVIRLSSCELRYKDVEVGVPSFTEVDGITREMFPSETRLRNITYSAPVFLTVERVPLPLPPPSSSSSAVPASNPSVGNASVPPSSSSKSSNGSQNANSTQNGNGNKSKNGEEEKDDVMIDISMIDAAAFADPRSILAAAVGNDGSRAWRPTYAQEKVLIGHLPVMLNSSLCKLSSIPRDEWVAVAKEDPTDCGGYFIVKGTEKQLVDQQRLANNFIHICQRNQPPHAYYNVEIRSSVERASRPTSTLFIHMAVAKTPQKVSLLIPYLRRDKDLPLGILFQALGVLEPHQWQAYMFRFAGQVFGGRQRISPNMADWFQCTIDDARQTLPENFQPFSFSASSTAPAAASSTGTATPSASSQQDLDTEREKEREKELEREKEKARQDWERERQERALAFIASYMNLPASHTPAKRLMAARDLISKEFLPHIGVTWEDRHNKLFYLGYAVCRLYAVFWKMRDMDDRDHIGNQRMETSGSLCASLFRMLLKRLNKEIRSSAEKLLEKRRNFSLRSLYQPRQKIITKGMKYALATGNWGADKNGLTAKTGVSQTVPRMNILGFQNSNRKQNTPIGRDGKLAKPRMLHESAFGFQCPAGTPDGEQCGLVRDKSVLTMISMDQPKDALFQLLLKWGLEPLWPDSDPSVTRRSESDPMGCRLYNDFVIPPLASTKLSVSPSFSSSTTASNATANASITSARFFPTDKLLVFLNGALVGLHSQDTVLWNKLVKHRRSQDIHPETSIVYHRKEQELWIYTDAGRLLRPVFVVDPVKQTIPALEEQLAFCSDSTKEKEEEEEEEKEMENGGEKKKKVKLRQVCHQWDDWLRKRYVEWVSPEEAETAVIAQSKYLLPHYAAQNPRAAAKYASISQHSNMLTKYSYCEIDPSVIFGICAASIVFADHNQSPRNTYQCAMGKQAVGVPFLNGCARMDTVIHELYYPQRPLVATRYQSVLHMDERPCGQELMVLIMPFEYNQEDSVILNQGMIDRGGMRSTKIQTNKLTVGKRGHSGTSVLMNPSDEVLQQLGALKQKKLYASLEEDGIVGVGLPLASKQALVGRFVGIGSQRPAPSSFSSSSSSLKNSSNNVDASSNEPGGASSSPNHAPSYQSYQNASTFSKHGENSTVHRVMLANNEEGNLLIKIMTREVRRPEIGDKFASCHGQKGVCGMIYPEEDMPFSMMTGMRPDIIVNPQAFPSRMTLGMLMQELAGKVAVLEGKFEDGTSFGETTMEELKERLHRAGYPGNGYETFINGTSGELYKGIKMTMAPCYYQRLRHMVADKEHAVSHGPIEALSRQPVEGRAQDGGFRNGEMERDCQISHGASRLLKERLFEQSDYYLMWICDECGMPGDARSQHHLPPEQLFCRQCGTGEYLKFVQIPYASKLFFQEATAMMVLPRLFST